MQVKPCRNVDSYFMDGLSYVAEKSDSSCYLEGGGIPSKGKIKKVYTQAKYNPPVFRIKVLDTGEVFLFYRGLLQLLEILHRDPVNPIRRADERYLTVLCPATNGVFSKSKFVPYLFQRQILKRHSFPP